MLTTARIREDLQPASLDWVSALKSADLRTLLKQHRPDSADPQPDRRAPLHPRELVPDQVAEIHSPDFPGERLLVCLNPRLTDERARQCERLLRATEQILERIAEMVRRRSSPVLRKGGKEAIDRRVGREANRRMVEKHFRIQVSDNELRWERKQGSIVAEAALDGIYVVLTSMPQDKLAADEAVAAYKRLARVERAFRHLETERLQLRPVHVYDEEHVRGHVFLCMLAYYVESHLRRKLAAPEVTRRAGASLGVRGGQGGQQADSGRSAGAESCDTAGASQDLDAELRDAAGRRVQRVSAGGQSLALAGQGPGTARCRSSDECFQSKARLKGAMGVGTDWEIASQSAGRRSSSEPWRAPMETSELMNDATRLARKSRYDSGTRLI